MLQFDNTLASGIFKFSGRINPPEVLAHIARHGFGSDPNFLKLSVRRCDGDRKIGIAFEYRYDGTEQGFDEFMDQCIKRLNSGLGDLLVGWDVSRRTIVVK